MLAFALLLLFSCLSQTKGYFKQRTDLAPIMDENERSLPPRAAKASIINDNAKMNHHPTRYIVHLDSDAKSMKTTTHSTVESYMKEVFSKHQFRVTNRFKHVVNAIVVDGLSYEQLKQIPGVSRVTKDMKRYALGQKRSQASIVGETRGPMDKLAATAGKSWGQDRIHESNWKGYNNASDWAKSTNIWDYNPNWRGSGVDVYVIDTGIDVTHPEFATGTYGQVGGREVRNIYNYYRCDVSYPTDACVAMRKNPTGTDSWAYENNDGNGHGTHCAGTVGGLNDGVSAGANIFGLKVLSDEGSGYSSTTLEALEYLYDTVIPARVAADTSRRSVISMSLGGDCEVSGQSNDPLYNCELSSDIVALEKILNDLNAVAAVAAGNEYTNACFTSPAFSTTAITVGALDTDDYLATFSNFGECVDIIAPGVDIRSACSSLLDCENDGLNDYLVLSGTSMATPHVAGVLAQLLERYPTASPDEIKTYLTCTALKDEVYVDTFIKRGLYDSITPNLLLQIPRIDVDPTACTEGLGCLNSCSSKGKCLNQRSPVYYSTDVIYKTCHCGVKYDGTDCSNTVDFSTCPAGTVRVKVMFEEESTDDIWSYTAYSISSISDLDDIKDYALDNASPFREGITRNYCLPVGCYNMNLATGYQSSEVAWSINNLGGGLPKKILFQRRPFPFCVDSNGVVTAKCNPTDQNNPTIPATIDLINSKSDASDKGWYGAHYELKNPSGVILYSGYLSSNQKSFSHGICVPVVNLPLYHTLKFSVQPTTSKTSVSMAINGIYVVTPTAPAFFYVNGSNVQVLTTASSTTPTVAPTQSKEAEFKYSQYLYILILVLVAAITIGCCVCVMKPCSSKMQPIPIPTTDIDAVSGVSDDKAKSSLDSKAIVPATQTIVYTV